MNYSIKKTSKKQREKMVKEALAISLSDALPPSEETVKLVKKFIDGEMELEEIQKEIILMHKVVK